jgi:hypothetical protein
MLAQIGFNTMAGTSQFGLENLGKGAAAAMPAMQEAIKSRRADDKEDLKQQYAFKLAEAGVSSKAFEYAMNRDDSAKDLKLKIRKLDEDVRHNEALERLQGQQITATAANKSATENFSDDFYNKFVADHTAKTGAPPNTQLAAQFRALASEKAIKLTGSYNDPNRDSASAARLADLEFEVTKNKAEAIDRGPGTIAEKKAKKAALYAGTGGASPKRIRLDAQGNQVP